METEKIYCCDRNENDNAIAAAILANKNDGSIMWPLAMMNGGMNGWNNPLAYFMFLALFRNGGFGGWGDASGAGPATQGIEMQAQLNAIRTQLQDNQNAEYIKSALQGNAFALSQLGQTLNIDFNALQKSCCDVQAAIQQVAGQMGLSAERVINAANMGDCRIIEALKDCCCSTKQLVQQMGYENQLGQKDIQFTTQQGFCNLGHGLQTGLDFVNRSIERGFASSSYETQKQTCDIINAGNANTQRIIDTLNAHWKDEQALQIQDLKFQLSQERQNNLLLNHLGSNCGCGSSYGCGCGCGQ